MKQSQGPQFIRFFKPILEILKEMGGSGNAKEVIDKTIERMNLSRKDKEATNKYGYSRVKNQVNWARLYLVRGGYLYSPKRGLWRLTEKGKCLNLEAFDVLGTFQQVRIVFNKIRLNESKTNKDHET